jgi:ferredoxin
VPAASPDGRAGGPGPPPAGPGTLGSVPELSPVNRIAVRVDRALCIGSGDCVDSAPDVFQLDEEDKAVVVDPDGGSVDDVLGAAYNCPVSAIFVIAEEGDLYP